MANISQGQLRTLINQMVEQALGEKIGARQSSWLSQQTFERPYLTYAHNLNNRKDSSNKLSDIYGVGSNLTSFGSIFRAQDFYEKQAALEKQETSANDSPDESSLSKFGRGLSGLGNGVQGFVGLSKAYQNRDPLGGAMSGHQMLTGLGTLFNAGSSAMAALGWAGMGLGFLTGLFGKPKKIDEWQKPKFKKAETAYNKLFTVDRGEEDLYYMPESFYFRSGWQGPRHVVVKVGNEQFDNHIRESLTSNYATQLQRGLVF